MCWLGLYFPALSLEIFRQREATPDAEDDTPCVVIEGRRIIYRNAQAAAAGIRLESSLATAQSIVPTLRHYRRDQRAEEYRLKRLGEVLYRFSNRISMIGAAGLVIEIGKSLRLFGSETAIAQQAESLCRTLGHAVVWRIAFTPRAAFLLARAGHDTLDSISLTQASIEPRVLTDDHCEQLAAMGIHTLGQLRRLPRADIALRFGSTLVSHLERVEGHQPDPMTELRFPLRFRSTLHLLSPIRDKNILLRGPMSRLLAELVQWLVSHQLATSLLHWRFESGARDESAVRFDVRLAQSQREYRYLESLCRLGFDRIALPAEVLSLELRVDKLETSCGTNRPIAGLLTPGSRISHAAMAAAQDTTTLATLVDRLETRLGKGICHGLQSVDQPLPEASWAMTAPFAPKSSERHQHRVQSRAPATQQNIPKQTAPLKPSWIFTKAHVIDIHSATLLQGPERIESGWWMTDSGEPCWRDYYIAQLRNGAIGWIFTDASRDWYLQGYFG
ncbi:MAG: Y-family DNA polymerase [Pseudomonadales bacterium]